MLPLTVRGSAGSAQEVEAVIDTGFSGFLTLPSALVAALGLTFDGVGWAVLGMRLLEGHDLHVEVESGGRVVIEAR